MTWRVVFSASAGDAFLLSSDVPKHHHLLYDRSAGTVAEIADPALLEARASWRPFLGDGDVIIEDVKRIMEAT